MLESKSKINLKDQSKGCYDYNSYKKNGLVNIQDHFNKNNSFQNSYTTKPLYIYIA